MMQKILKYSIWTGLLLTLFIPLIVPSDMFFPFITGKGFAFRLLVEISAGLFIVLAFLDSKYRPKLSLITKSVLAFTLVALVADLFSVNAYKSLWSNYERMEGFVLIFHLLLYYIVASSFLKTKNNWNIFLNTSIFASLITSFYGVLQLTGKLTINQGGVRLDATLGNATYFAIYLVFNIFLCIYMLVDKAKPQWQKWTYAVIAFLEVIILYFTATRGAILGLIGGLILASLLIIWKERENIFLRKMAYGVLGLIVFLLVLFVSARNAEFVRTSPVLSRFASLSSNEIKTQGRYFVWPMAIKGFIDKPILGWGQESFNFVFNKYYDPRMYAQEQWFDRTHNVFLDWLIAGGLIGFFAYLSLYIALFYYIWKKSPLSITEKSVLTGMISAYIFNNVFVFDNLISYIMFFSVLAYIHAINTEGNSPVGKFYAKTFDNNSVNYFVLPITTVLICGFIYFVNYPAYAANKDLIRAISPQQKGIDENLRLFKQIFDYNSFGSAEALEQLVQTASQISAMQQVPDATKKAFYDYAKEKLEEKIKQTPSDARYLVFAGSFFNRFGQYDEAIKYLEKALENSPKKQSIYFELGTSYIGKGDTKKMEEIFKEAYDLEPNSPESTNIYAIGAIYGRNNDVLRNLLSKINRDTIITDNRFLQAYVAIGNYNAVIDILKERLIRNPDSQQDSLSLSYAYAITGQKTKAIEIINNLIKKDPNFKSQGEEYIRQIQNL